MHPEKDEFPIKVTEFGIKSDPLNPEQLKKAKFPIFVTFSGIKSFPLNPKQPLK